MRSSGTVGAPDARNLGRMGGIGHFPFAENPPLFAEHLLPILEELRGGA